MLGGCAADKFASPAQSKPDIGAAPAYAGEVRVRMPGAGESPVVVAERYRAGLDKANTIIRCMIEDRADTRSLFLGVSATKTETDTCAKPADAVKGRRKARRR